MDSLMIPEWLIYFLDLYYRLYYSFTFCQFSNIFKYFKSNILNKKLIFLQLSKQSVLVEL